MLVNIEHVPVFKCKDFIQFKKHRGPADIVYWPNSPLGEINLVLLEENSIGGTESVLKTKQSLYVVQGTKQIRHRDIPFASICIM